MNKLMARIYVWWVFNRVPLLLMCVSGVVAAVAVYTQHWKSRHKFYETVCLVESELLVTYRGVTTLPRKQQIEGGHAWVFFNENRTKITATGDCFYHER